MLLTTDRIISIFGTSLGRLTLLFISWRFALAFVTLFGLSFLANIDFRSNTLAFPSPGLDYWGRWGRWDGGHYQSIAVNGYAPHQTMWFPAYPLLIRLLMLTGLQPLWAGLAISHISAIAALYYLYGLAKLDFGAGTATRVIVALLMFPTSFYLVAVYNESLFLAVTLASFYFARKEKWAVAAILAGMAGATRIMGLATIGGIMAEYMLRDAKGIYIENSASMLIRRAVLPSLVVAIALNLLRAGTSAFQFAPFNDLVPMTATASTFVFSAVTALTFAKVILRPIVVAKLISRQFVCLIFSLFPLFGYLAYQQAVFGNALSFMAYEAKNYNKVLTFPWRGPQDAIAIVLQRGLTEIGDGTRFLAYLIFFTAMIAGLVITLHRYRTSYAIYYLLVLLLPLSSGTLMDMPRYSLTFFPFFFVVAHIRDEFLQTTGILFSVMMLSALAMLFINGYWFM